MRAILVGAISLILCGACAAARSTLTGSLMLTQDTQLEKSEAGCTGSGGYQDIHTGADIIIKDGAGAILAKSTLMYAPRDGENTGIYGGKYPRQCPLAFTVSDVPAADFYVISIGARPPLTYSAAEMEAMGWKLDLTLGP